MSVDDAPAVDPTPSTPDPSISALGDNIARKGKNAYYYAHAHKATGPKWDGKIEPRLLSSTTSLGDLSVSEPPLANGGDGDAPSRAVSSRAALLERSNITSYAFLDEALKVKIYVDLPGVGNCREEDVALDFTESSLCVTVHNYVAPSENDKGAGAESEALVVDTAPAQEEETEEGNKAVRCLSFEKLFGRIDGATLRKKPDKLVITLRKKDGDKRIWKSVIA